MEDNEENYNTDLKIDTQLQYLIMLFFREKDNIGRKDITIAEVMAYIPDNMELWIEKHEGKADRAELEGKFRKRVQDVMSGLRNFTAETRRYTDGRIIAQQTFQALERDPASYEWRAGKDIVAFVLYVLGELGSQFDIMIYDNGESEITPYSKRCILTRHDQLFFLDYYRKSGLIP